MTAVKHVLVELSDQAWQRTRDRIEGLTDEEYLWEPAPGCWTIRPGPDGEWKADWPLPRPDPEPFTTIAWRLWHLIDMYGENRAPNWLGVPRQGEAVGFEGGEGVPSAAADAIAMLERAHTRWDAHLGAGLRREPRRERRPGRRRLRRPSPRRLCAAHAR